MQTYTEIEERFLHWEEEEVVEGKNRVTGGVEILAEYKGVKQRRKEVSFLVNGSPNFISQINSDCKY